MRIAEPAVCATPTGQRVELHGARAGAGDDEGEEHDGWDVEQGATPKSVGVVRDDR